MKLTTDSIKYHSEIKRLLTSDYDAGWTLLWNYCEMTSMFFEGHSFSFLMKDSLGKRKFIYRKWNHTEQKDKNDLGIFSLENIKITEEELPISLNELFEIQNFLNSDLQINKTNGFVLDGIDFELTDFKNDRKYSWKLDEERDIKIKRLVEIIKKKKST